jgi:hypothetical protein
MWPSVPETIQSVPGPQCLKGATFNGTHAGLPDTHGAPIVRYLRQRRGIP